MPDPKHLEADIRACIGFYTRVPIAFGPGSGSFADAQWAAPVAGVVIGLAAALLLGLALRLGLPAPVAAMLALGAAMLIGGALHEDGLADVADGFGGGRTPERKLEIMRDSRIGTYGAAALIVGILLRWSALTAIAAQSGWHAGLAMVAAHAASRALFPLFMRLVPPARADGLSAGIGRVGYATARAALAIGAAALLLIGLPGALLAALLLAILFVGLKRLAERQIGGQTGDVLGALQQGAETMILIAASANLP